MEGLGVAVALPDIRVLLEVRSLRSYDAKPLARWRLHDPPGLHLCNALGTKSFESTCLGLDVVGFDVKMNPALVSHCLNKNLHLVWWTFEHSIWFGRIRIRLCRPTDCRRPKTGRSVNVIGLAIDDDVAPAALMHAGSRR